MENYARESVKNLQNVNLHQCVLAFQVDVFYGQKVIKIVGVSF